MRVRYLRSMSNRVLASRLGVHPTTVSRWKGKPPEWAAGHIATLKKLEEALWGSSDSDSVVVVVPSITTPRPSDIGSPATGESVLPSTESGTPQRG